MNLSKYFIKFSLVLFFLISFAEKSISVEPDEFVQSIVDKASKVLANNINKEQRIKKINLLFSTLTVQVLSVQY